MAIENMKPGYQNRKDPMRERAQAELGSELRAGKMHALKKGGRVKKAVGGMSAARPAPLVEAMPPRMAARNPLKKGGEVHAPKKAIGSKLKKSPAELGVHKKKGGAVRKNAGGVLDAGMNAGRAALKATPFMQGVSAAFPVVGKMLKKGGKVKKAAGGELNLAAPLSALKKGGKAKPVKKAMGGVGKIRHDQYELGKTKKRGR